MMRRLRRLLFGCKIGCGRTGPHYRYCRYFEGVRP